jgi:hypothetical protein
MVAQGVLPTQSAVGVLRRSVVFVGWFHGREIPMTPAFIGREHRTTLQHSVREQNVFEEHSRTGPLQKEKRILPTICGLYPRRIRQIFAQKRSSLRKLYLTSQCLCPSQKQWLVPACSTKRESMELWPN